MYFQEFLAFSDGPVKMEDVLKMSGMKVPFSTPSKRDGHQHQDSDPTRPSSGANIAKLPKAMFLSTWRGPTIPGHSNPHPSIHHFCTELHCPQLPPQMKIISRLSHANRNPDVTRAYLRNMEEASAGKGAGRERRRDGRGDHEAGWEDRKDFGGGRKEEDREKYSGNVVGLNSFEERRSLDQGNTPRGDSERKATPCFRVDSTAAKSPYLTVPTGKRRTRSVDASSRRSSRNQVAPHRSILDNVNGATSTLIGVARTRLRKEIRGNKKFKSHSKSPRTSGVRNIWDKFPPTSVTVKAKMGVEEGRGEGGGGGRGVEGEAKKKMEKSCDERFIHVGGVMDEATEVSICPTVLKADVMREPAR